MPYLAPEKNCRAGPACSAGSQSLGAIVMVNLCCQVDAIWNWPGDGPLTKSARKSLP